MTTLSEPARQALLDHSAFDQTDEARFVSTTTTFDASVVATATDDRTVFTVSMAVPLLDAVTEDEVADVVEDGWYETFELRTQDIGGIFRTERDLSPTVSRHAETIAVEVTLTDHNPRRGVDDAAAVIDFIEGTYVQGIIPGYTYTDPVDSIMQDARNAGGSR